MRFLQPLKNFKIAGTALAEVGDQQGGKLDAGNIFLKLCQPSAECAQVEVLLAGKLGGHPLPQLSVLCDQERIVAADNQGFRSRSWLRGRPRLWGPGRGSMAFRGAATEALSRSQVGHLLTPSPFTAAAAAWPAASIVGCGASAAAYPG